MQAFLDQFRRAAHQAAIIFEPQFQRQLVGVDLGIDFNHICQPRTAKKQAVFSAKGFRAGENCIWGDAFYSGKQISHHLGSILQELKDRCFRLQKWSAVQGFSIMGENKADLLQVTAESGLYGEAGDQPVACLAAGEE